LEKKETQETKAREQESSRLPDTSAAENSHEAKPAPAEGLGAATPTPDIKKGVISPGQKVDL
jgi:hypothetical protein